MQDFLRLSGISKTFGGVKALTDVDMTVGKGELLCLMGENGSGKSTMIKIISGVQPATTGTMEVEGEEVRATTTAEMIHRGIQVIYQDLSLMPNLTVAENIAMARSMHEGRVLVRWGEMRRIALKAMARIGAQIDPNAMVGDLPVGTQQMVAICRAFTTDVKLLILDEPTASLNRSEIDALLALVREMKARGISIIFISHKIDEVIEIADRVTCLRDGYNVGSLSGEDLTYDAVVELMTGHAVKHVPFVPSLAPGKAPVLSVRNLTKRNNFADVSFDLHAGEILGIAGLLGSGRTEIAKALFGLAPADTGEITVDGQVRSIRSVRDAVAAGVAYVPENRLTEGLFLQKPVADNLVSNIVDGLAISGPLVNQARRDEEIIRWVDELSIKVSDPIVPVRTLSGGNQQRVVLGKWLATAPRVLILNGPTVGVDINAKAAIYDIIHRLAHNGAAVILISDEAPEIISNTNRILLVKGGRVQQELQTAETDVDHLHRLVEAA